MRYFGTRVKSAKAHVTSDRIKAAGCAQGLLNGIDTALWDPATDPLIPAPFTPERLEGKALCKRYLQQGLGLDATPDKPIVACITRLVPQKVSWLVHA